MGKGARPWRSQAWLKKIIPFIIDPVNPANPVIPSKKNESQSSLRPSASSAVNRLSPLAARLPSRETGGVNNPLFDK